MYKVPNTNPDDVNTAVVNYYQHDVVSFRDVVILGVLEVRRPKLSDVYCIVLSHEHAVFYSLITSLYFFWYCISPLDFCFQGLMSEPFFNQLRTRLQMG